MSKKQIKVAKEVIKAIESMITIPIMDRNAIIEIIKAQANKIEHLELLIAARHGDDWETLGIKTAETICITEKRLACAKVFCKERMKLEIVEDYENELENMLMKSLGILPKYL